MLRQQKHCGMFFLNNLNRFLCAHNHWISAENFFLSLIRFGNKFLRALNRCDEFSTFELNPFGKIFTYHWISVTSFFLCSLWRFSLPFSATSLISMDWISASIYLPMHWSSLVILLHEMNQGGVSYSLISMHWISGVWVNLLAWWISWESYSLLYTLNQCGELFSTLHTESMR